MHEAGVEEAERRPERGGGVQRTDGEVHWEVPEDKGVVFVLFDFGEERGGDGEEHSEVPGLQEGGEGHKGEFVELPERSHDLRDDLQ